MAYYSYVYFHQAGRKLRFYWRWFFIIWRPPSIKIGIKRTDGITSNYGQITLPILL